MCSTWPRKALHTHHDPVGPLTFWVSCYLTQIFSKEKASSGWMDGLENEIFTNGIEKRSDARVLSTAVLHRSLGRLWGLCSTPDPLFCRLIGRIPCFLDRCSLFTLTMVALSKQCLLENYCCSWSLWVSGEHDAGFRYWMRGLSAH